MTNRIDTHILLVEDDLDHVALAHAVFKRHGVEPNVHTVKDGAEALDFVMGYGAYEGQGTLSSLKLIFLDLNIPKIPGLEVLRRLKADKQTDKIPVVMVTISKDEPDLLQSFTLGVSDYIIKPMGDKRFTEVYTKYVVLQ
jgi:two-component system response regulator